MCTFKIGVLGSGSGTVFEALAQAQEQGVFKSQIVAVLSDNEDAYILQRAKNHGVPGLYVQPGPFRTKLDQEAEERYIKTLQDYGVNLLVLAGFMRVIKKGLIGHFPQRILNTHPALLPSFPGLAAWEQALDYGVKVTGCTIHFVDEGVDTGPIILQEAVPVLADDTSESLHKRIQALEYELYPRAIQLLETSEVSIEGRKVVV